MNFKKTMKNLRKDARGISPIIATLLLIAIAVVAALVVYAWVMGYMSFTTNKTGQSIQIQSASVGGVLYVQNVGNGPVTFGTTCVYVDGSSVTATITGLTSGSLPTGSTATLTIPAFTPGTHSYDIKVTTAGGTFSEISQVFP